MSALLKPSEPKASYSFNIRGNIMKVTPVSGGIQRARAIAIQRHMQATGLSYPDACNQVLSINIIN